MSKAWDIQPNAPKASVSKKPQKKVPTKQSEPSSRSFAELVPKRAPTRKEAVRHTSLISSRVPLGKRRRTRRKQFLVLCGCIFLLLVTLIEVVLWQPWFRISAVTAEGANAEQVKIFAERELRGTRFLILPKNSLFFTPEKTLRAHVLTAFPDIEAVSITPVGLNSLKVIATSRATVFWWCGVGKDVPATSCYLADASGVVFAQVPPEQTQASSSVLSLYAPLAQTLGATPVGNSVSSPALLPPMVQFVKAMRVLGADVVSVALHGDEADIYTRAGTRITYVLGREQKAAGLATSAFPSLNLNDGSLLYVDLRFDSKVFFKKK